MEAIHVILYIVVVIVSVMLPEIVHGLVALEQGDLTPKNAGRLTLDPLRHIDIAGSIIFPLILILTHAGFVIGWAKPVPYNVHNFQNRKAGTAMVALGGIFTNVCLAFIFGIALRIAIFNGYANPWFMFIATAFTLVNILLALFNALPIPPLDGFTLLSSIIPGKTERFQSTVEYYSVPILIIAIVFLWPYIYPSIDFLFTHLSGTALVLS